MAIHRQCFTQLVFVMSHHWPQRHFRVTHLYCLARSMYSCCSRPWEMTADTSMMFLTRRTRKVSFNILTANRPNCKQTVINDTTATGKVCRTGRSAAGWSWAGPVHRCGWTAGCLHFAPSHWQVFCLSLGQESKAWPVHSAQKSQKEAVQKHDRRTSWKTIGSLFSGGNSGLNND